MTIAQMDINGNPYIGIFCAANENLAVVPYDFNKKMIEKLKKTLQLEILSISIAGTKLIGSLLAMNSNGAIVNNFTETQEILKLKKLINVAVIDEKLNAIGNNILTNDHRAMVHKQFSKNSIKQISDTLDVEVMKGTIAGLRTIGAAAVITNRGGLCHPKATLDELEFLKSVFKIEIITGTANYGTPFVGACVIANSKGAITGNNTTGIELGRIEDGLSL